MQGLLHDAAGPLNGHQVLLLALALYALILWVLGRGLSGERDVEAVERWTPDDLWAVRQLSESSEELVETPEPASEHAGYRPG